MLTFAISAAAKPWDNNLPQHGASFADLRRLGQGANRRLAHDARSLKASEYEDRPLSHGILSEVFIRDPTPREVAGLAVEPRMLPLRSRIPNLIPRQPKRWAMGEFTGG